MISEPAPFAQSNLRVLIVEDELFVAWHVEDILRELKLDVCGVAAGGQEAIEKATELKADLILMDIHLDGPIDGIEAAQRIRQNSSAGIIFITAYSDVTVLKRIQTEVPGAPVLAKPASLEKVRAAIVQVIDQTRRQ